MNKYTADFETITCLEDETYVWAWAICNIENYNIEISNNIESFIEFCKNSNNSIFYFHNLKFDGEFIIYYLEKNGFKYIANKKDRINKSYTTLISDKGQFYSLEIYFEVYNKKVIKATFYDSLKIIPFSVKTIAKSFNLVENKLKLNYNKYRSRHHILTQEEKEYIKNDVLIVAKALHELFNQNLTHMTQASNALNNYKSRMSQSRFNHLFPKIDYENWLDLKQAYKGGFTYLNSIYKEKEVKKGIVLDVNSLYPSVMKFSQLPFGEPIFYDGKYKDDKVYPLYIQHISCIFELKENKIPTIQIKNNPLNFKATEYLRSSDNSVVNLVLTNIDLKLFLENYNVYDLKYKNGWKFKCMIGMFDDYINYWNNQKIESAKLKNYGKRTIAKFMLNSLYGRFAMSLIVRSKKPYLQNDIVKYALEEEEIRDGLYLPIGAFITSYAREKTIRTSQKIKEYSIQKYGEDKYIYSDTDSIHTLLEEEELKKICEIDDFELRKMEN